MSAEKFESWAIIDLFGHQRLAGLCTAVDLGGASFVRIDVPDIEKEPGAPPKLTRLVNPAAIYSITPVTEETARIAAKGCSIAPLTSWDVRDVINQERRRLVAVGDRNEPRESDTDGNSELG